MSENQIDDDLLDGFGARKACDQCRKRKIRCDRNTPCASCKTAGHSCTTSIRRRTPVEQHRSRVLVTNQYDKKLDMMDHRLQNIEDAILSLSSRASSSSARDSPRSHIDYTTAYVSGEQYSSDDLMPGGDYTLKMQTLQASDFLEHAVAQGRVRELNPSIHEALTNLRQLVERQRRGSASHEQRFPLQRPIPDGGLSKLPMPPLNVVIPLLNQASIRVANVFTTNCALVGLNDLLVLCHSVYASPQTATHAELTLVNAALYYLFAEKQSDATTLAQQYEYQYHARLSQGNLETCIKNFPLLMSSKITNVQALLLSVFYSIDTCRPSIAWHLNATAVRLCQDGGFHRLEGTSEDPQLARTKSNLFWQAFTLDKSLSLRLGRASTIHDWEITIPRQINLVPDPHTAESSVPKLWLLISPLRAQAYEKLYSPEALSSPPAELIRRARELATVCQGMEGGVAEIRADISAQLGSSPYPLEFVQLMVTSSTVQFYVTETLIYRAIPAHEGSSSRFCDECLDAARNAVECHLGGVEAIGADPYLRATYVHWTLMLTPFAPFFVLFCHIIETLNTHDLDLFKSFAASLDTLKGASGTSQKLFNLCQAMCDVACAYQEDVLQGGQQAGPELAANLGADFDAFLAPLGSRTHSGSPPNMYSSEIPEISDWFFGGRGMFE